MFDRDDLVERFFTNQRFLGDVFIAETRLANPRFRFLAVMYWLTEHPDDGPLYNEMAMMIKACDTAQFVAKSKGRIHYSPELETTLDYLVLDNGEAWERHASALLEDLGL